MRWISLRTALAPLLLAACAVLAAPAACAATSLQAPDSLADPTLVFRFWPGQEPLARHLHARAQAMPPLPALPEGALADGAPVQVFLAPDAARFDSLTDGRAPEWGAGVAIPDAGIVVLPGYRSDRAAPHELTRILRHELAHVALRRHLGPARIPRWFDEGYARWAAGEWDWEAAWRLRIAFALNRAPPLDSLSLAWPAAEADARIAYFLSATAIAFLVERSGEHGLRLFLQRWRETGDLETALRRTYGLTLSQFEEDWREEVRGRYGWTLFLSHTLVFWLAVALLVLLVGHRRRRWNRARLAHLRATEPPDSPAYWEGEDPEAEPAPDEPPSGPARP